MDTWVAVLVRASDTHPASIIGPAIALNMDVAVPVAETTAVMVTTPVAFLWLVAGPAEAAMDEMYLAPIRHVLRAEVKAPDGHRYMAAILHPEGRRPPKGYKPDIVPTGKRYRPCNKAAAEALADLATDRPKANRRWRDLAVKAVEEHRRSAASRPQPVGGAPRKESWLCGVWPLSAYGG